MHRICHILVVNVICVFLSDTETFTESGIVGGLTL